MITRNIASASPAFAMIVRPIESMSGYAIAIATAIAVDSYEVQPLDAEGQPGQLLVRVNPDRSGRDRWVLITVFEGLGENLPDADLVQFFCRLPVDAPDPGRRGDFTRLLLAVNNVSSVGQFCICEVDGLLYFRAIGMFPRAEETWNTLLYQHMVLAVFQMDEFGASIEAVANGELDARGAIAADPLLGSLA